MRRRFLPFVLMSIALPEAGFATCLPVPLARGVSLAGVDSSDIFRQTSSKFLGELKARGLDHIRLPIAAEELTSRFGAPGETEALLSNLDEELSRLINLGFAVVIDMHGGAAFGDLTMADPQATGEAVVEAWGHVAPLVNAAPKGRIYAEIFNEPKMETADWLALQDQLTPKLRALMPDVTLVLSAGGAQRADAQVTMPASADENVLWSVHYYDPMVFTHQGASFMAGSVMADLTGIPFPLNGRDPRLADLASRLEAAGKTEAAAYIRSAPDYSFGPENIAADMAGLKAWSERSGQPVWIGEFGVLRDAAPEQDREFWLKTVRVAAESNCLGWAHWDATSGFGLIDPATGALDEGTMAALTGR